MLKACAVDSLFFFSFESCPYFFARYALFSSHAAIFVYSISSSLSLYNLILKFTLHIPIN